MSVSCPWPMLVVMKLIATVAGLVLAGLVAGWLWLDASADVGGDTAGVVITGAVDPAQMSGAALTVQGTAPEEETAAVVSVLRASAGELADRADERRSADTKTKADTRTEEQSRAVEVQPAPVNPGGWCEWDDDDGWECDDYDDLDDD